MISRDYPNHFWRLLDGPDDLQLMQASGRVAPHMSSSEISVRFDAK